MNKRQTFNFFAAQSNAKSKTFYFVLAFILVSLILSAINSIIINFIIVNSETTENLNTGNSEIFFILLACHLLLFFGAGYYQFFQSPKGEEIALNLGGTRMLNKIDLGEAKIRLLNVVQEMSIASGVPMPHVYCLEDDDSINAFAAGTSSQDFVVAVTNGCLQKLTRDELQAVIGHEFSHMLNEDMRLQLRLISSLLAFQIIARLGTEVLSSSSRSRSKPKNAGAAYAIALVFIVIGFLGLWLSQWLQSLISKQREFLADAASAQFTRNPSALASALTKISNIGSQITSSDRIRYGHFFFSDCENSRSFFSFNSHPPIHERISRLNPLIKSIPNEPTTTPSKELTASSMLGLTGKPSVQSLDSAKNILSSLDSLTEKIVTTEDAKIALYALCFSFQSNYEDLLNKFKLEPEKMNLINEVKNALYDKSLEKTTLYQIILSPLRLLNNTEMTALINRVLEIIAVDAVYNFDESVILFHLIGYQHNNNRSPQKSNLGSADELRIRKLFNGVSFSKEDFNFLKEKVLEIQRLTREQKRFFLLRTFENLGTEPERLNRYRLFCCAIGVPVPLL